MGRWVYKEIGEIANVKRGASPRPIQDPKWWGDEIGWVRISDVTSAKKYLYKTKDYLSPLGKSKSVVINKDEVILSICATIGRPIITKEKFCIHDGFVWFDGLSNLIDMEYFYYYLIFKEAEISSKKQIGTQGNLNTNIVSKVKIPIPSSKPEQTKIAEILSTVDKAIEQTEAIIAKQQRIKTGLMQDLLTKGIDKNGSIRSEKTHKFKDSPLGRIPVEWDIVSLGDEKYFELATGGTPSTLKKGYWEGGEIPWLSSGEVHKKFILETDNFITEKGYRNSNARIYPIESILIALAGQGKTRGTVAITQIELTSNQSVAAIIPKALIVSPYYIFYYLMSQYENLRTSSAGSGRAGLNLNILSEYLVKLPQKDEQKIISEILLSIEKHIYNEFFNLNKLQKLKTALMQDLLTGKVRVTKLLENETSDCVTNLSDKEAD